MKRLVFTSLLLLPLFHTVQASTQARWYSADQVEQGQKLFSENCARCHGNNAEATPNWKQTDENGKYPPPPLNGTGHAWHHELAQLQQSIREGGQQLGGTMPPFKAKLSAQQIDQAIAYFQSKWPDELYQKWAARFEVKSLPASSNETDQKVLSKQKSVTQRLSSMLGNVEIDEAKPTGIENIWQVQLKNRFVYLLDDGRYALIGDLIDLQKGQNLTEKERRFSAINTMNSYADKDLIIFQPEGVVKSTLNVFTDTSCPYCRKLHEEIPQLLASGIKVRYLPYARGGSQGPGYQTLKSVWCAQDRAQSINNAFADKTENLSNGDCTGASIVDAAYQSGNQLGISGTPALFKQNGEKIEGYVPFKQLVPMLLNP